MRTFKYKKTAKSSTPSETQIQKYKDFASMAHHYETITKRPKKPLYKNPRLFLILFVLGLMCLLLFLDEK